MHGYIRVFSNAAVVQVFSTRQRVMGYPHVFSRAAVVFFFLVEGSHSLPVIAMQANVRILSRAQQSHS